MTGSSVGNFYADLPALAAREGLCDMNLHTPVPSDWYIAVADVTNSTEALSEGKYKDVNVVSAGAIIAVLNRTERNHVPYIFGGDGATFLVPPELKMPVASALYGTRVMARDNFGLELRTGMVPVSRLLEQNAPVRVAKIETAPGIYQAALSGAGVALAEKLIKSPATARQHEILSLFDQSELAEAEPDFGGLECRWKPIESRNGIDISLIILSRLSDGHASTVLYQDVLRRIEKICGQRMNWSPVSESQLRVTSSFLDLRAENRVHTGGQGLPARLCHMLRLVFLTWIGKICFLFGMKVGNFDGRSYRRETVEHSDYIKFDNALRLVMDVTQDSKDQLVAYLDSLLWDQKIFYGLHSASSALMTCLVFNYHDQHFHFIDGADGGYSLAALQLKKQIIDSDSL